MGEIEILERSGGVRVVRLNRPDRLNALTPDMVRLITEAMEAGPDHRAIVITGSGRGFCAGVDIAGAHERQRGRSNADTFALQERFGGMVLAIARAPVPVISAVNGPAAGAGLAIALAPELPCRRHADARRRPVHRTLTWPVQRLLVCPCFLLP